MSILTLVSTAASIDQSAVRQCPSIVWADEFEGTTVDTSKWEFMIGTGADYGVPAGWGNGELQYYRSENAEVEGGSLRIIAKSEPYHGSDYTSARLRTRGIGDFTFGRVEARIRMTSGQGLWPAFWMLPTDEVFGGWPRSGEIDIMENIGSEPSTVHGTLHFGTPHPDHRFTGTSFSLPGERSFADDFHRFAVEREPGVIRWLVDDILYSTRTPSDLGEHPWPFDERFHLLLNVAVGGHWPGTPDATTSFPQTLEVDFVRVQDGNSPHLDGVREVVPGETGVVYRVGNAFAASTFSWELPAGARLVSGQGMRSIVVDWDGEGGEVAVEVTSVCGTRRISMPVSVGAAPARDSTAPAEALPADATP